MKRILLYGIILIGALMIPVNRLDVEDLEPVQTVWLFREGDRIVLETDTEDKGVGDTLEAALGDLKENCVGIIYLDTARFLLVAENARDQLADVKAHLKDSVKACFWDGEGSVAEAGAYMSAHKLGCALYTWETGGELPVLQLQKNK